MRGWFGLAPVAAGAFSAPTLHVQKCENLHGLLDTEIMGAYAEA